MLLQIYSLMRSHQKGVRNQTSNHDADSINRQRKTQLPQQTPPPIPALMGIAHDITFRVRAIEFILVVLVLDKPLVVRRVWIRDLVVEQPGEDEGDGGGTGGADVREDLLQRGNGHGGDEGEDDEDGRYDCEPQVAHFFRLAAGRGRASHQGVSARAVFALGSATWAPLEACVDTGTARVDLEWVGEHDQDYDCEAADGGGCGGRIHVYNVASDVVAV